MNYRYTDRMVAYLNRQLVLRFARLKSIMDFDELNVIREVNSLYEDINALVRRAFTMLAKQVYRDNVRLSAFRDLDEQWVDALLNSYDPVSKYVFAHEEDRRAARLAEAIIASPTKVQEIDAALRSTAFMYRVYAVRITDEAVLQAYKDNLEDGDDEEDEPMIKWIAEQDEKTCSVCCKRDGKIYPLSELPPKPHLNCRCMFEEVL